VNEEEEEEEEEEEDDDNAIWDPKFLHPLLNLYIDLYLKKFLVCLATHRFQVLPKPCCNCLQYIISGRDSCRGTFAAVLVSKLCLQQHCCLLLRFFFFLVNCLGHIQNISVYVSIYI
jgi:hypothetical protein